MSRVTSYLVPAALCQRADGRSNRDDYHFLICCLGVHKVAPIAWILNPYLQHAFQHVLFWAL